MMLSDSRRESAAWAVAHDETQAEAARRAGVDRATVGRWLKDPTFSGRVDEIRVVREDNARALESEPGDPTDDKFTELVDVAWEVIEAALKGEEGPGGRVPSTAQHTNALKTIELARKMQPQASSSGSSLADLIAKADAERSAG